MKAADIAPGMCVAIGSANSSTVGNFRMAYVVETSGWQKNSNIWSNRRYCYRVQGAKGVAIALRESNGFGGYSSWIEDVIALDKILGPYEVVSAEYNRNRHVEKVRQDRLLVNENALAAQRQALANRIGAILGDTICIAPSSPNTVSISISALSDLVDQAEGMIK